MTKDPGVRTSLVEYAKERDSRHRLKPWFETDLPPEVQAEVIDAWKNGVRGTPIVEWLRDIGYPEATKGRINTYLASRYGDA